MTGQREKGSKVVKAVTEAGSDREMMVMESVAKPRALINLSLLSKPGHSAFYDEAKRWAEKKGRKERESPSFSPSS